MAATASEHVNSTVHSKATSPSFFSIADAVRVHARSRPNKPALESRGSNCTWATLDARVTKVAMELRQRGVVRGQTVAMLVGNSVWSWTAILGALRAGATVVPISTMLRSAMVSKFLQDSAARFFVISQEWDQLALEAAATTDVTNFRESEKAFDAGEPSLPQGSEVNAILYPSDTCNIIYSSGTTGQPKGIVHSHAARIGLALQLSLAFRMSNETRTLVTTPPHTNVTWAMMLTTILLGGTAFLMPHFEASQVLQNVSTWKPTHSFLVPTQWRALLDHPDIESTSWDSLTAVVTGGAPMPLAMKTEVCRRTNWRLFEIWGFTESVVTIQNPSDMVTNPDAVGRPVVGCEIRIVDKHGADVTGREPGEIVGRSISLMDGYLGRPEETRALIWRDGAGLEFIRTGDIGEIDAAGYLTLRGRAKDMILSGGLNVFPIDIERVLMEHTGISDVTVVGVPHAYWGETPVAFVVPKPNVVIDRDALMAWANERLARFQKIADVVTVSDFPRNTLGKVIKSEVAARYSSRANAGSH